MALRCRFFLLFSPVSLLLHSLHQPSIAGPVAVGFLRPNFTAAYLNYVDNDGVFLESANSAFHLSLVNPGRQTSRFYVSVLHAATGSIVWTANPSAPLSYSSLSFSFTSAGLSVATSNSSDVRLTPPLPRPAALLRLLSSGELRLLDAANASLWSSFDHPTDTLLPGQLLAVSSSSSVVLSSSVSDSDPAPGDYRLVLTSYDASLQWAPGSQLYWTMSTDLRATKDSNSAVAYMAVNTTGLYLLDAEKRTAVFQMGLSPSSTDLRFARLDPSGRLTILRYSSNDTLSSSTLDTDFVAPASDCDLPLKCGSLGLCTDGDKGSTCSCPTMFGSSAEGCSPADGSVLANSSLCNDGVEAATSSSSLFDYVALDSKIEYFSNKFAVPTISGVDGSDCRKLCSANCSCLSYFYKNSSRSCYLIEHQLGSLSTGDSTSTTAAGFLKIVKSPVASKNSSSIRLVVILVPAIASFILVSIIGFIGLRHWKGRRHYRGEETNRATVGGNGLQQFCRPTASEFDIEADKDDDEFSIPGLPTRFSYAELKVATGDFSTRIGSGGFGSVYKGELPDKSVVAVKKVNNAGLQGKREFCAEIAVIGNIHHVNLVKLRGFCLQRPQRLLVYEYMNRGSLDRSLFGGGPPLEWQERMDIAVGAARGLAYLHYGCAHKIIHCDVKPENILLHDHNQVKIADFGLSKLLTAEQSGLFTAMRGTRGYLAPEWLTNSAITDKADVYSFGMVLLEIVRGRRNRSEEHEPTLITWRTSSGTAPMYFPSMAFEMHEAGRYEELADPRLEGRVTGPEIARVVKVALCCLHEEPTLRPSMAAVAGALDGTRPVPEPKVELLSTLRLYGRGFGSSDPLTREEFPGAVNDGSPATSSTSASSTSWPLLSYLSSQHLSGPR